MPSYSRLETACDAARLHAVAGEGLKQVAVAYPGRADAGEITAGLPTKGNKSAPRSVFMFCVRWLLPRAHQGRTLPLPNDGADHLGGVCPKGAAFLSIKRCRRSGLNRRPAAYKAAALPLSYGGDGRRLYASSNCTGAAAAFEDKRGKNRDARR